MVGQLVLHVISVGVLAALVASACRLGRFRPAVCHALWLVVLIKLMVPPVVQWPWCLGDRAATWRATGSTAIQTAGDPVGTSISGEAALPAQDPRATDSPSFQSHSAPWRPWIFAQITWALGGAWIIGTLVVTTIQGIRLHRFPNLMQAAKPAPAWLAACADKSAVLFGIGPVQVLTGDDDRSVFTWGARRSQILVPQRLLETLPRAAWTAILAHELAHLKRRDHWVGWLELAALCAWWWNPLLWLVRRRLSVYAEMACDAWVIRALPEHRRQYAETLVRVADFESKRARLAPVFGMAGNRAAAAFEQRLLLVMRGLVPCRIPRSAVAAIGILLLAVLPGWSLASPASEPAVPLAPTFESTPSPQTPPPGKSAENTGVFAEFRVYLARGNIKILTEPERPAKAEGPLSEPSYLQLRGILRNPTSIGALSVDGLDVRMNGPRLDWGGMAEPVGNGIASVASPAFPFTRNEGVGVSIPFRPGLLPNVPPGQLEMVCKFSGPDDGLRLWLLFTRSPRELASDNAPPGGALFRMGNVWTNVIVHAPHDTWEAMVCDLLDAQSRLVATLLMFWKFQYAVSPEQMAALRSQESGAWTVTRFEAPYVVPAYQYSTKTKVLEATEEAIALLTKDLPVLTEASLTPRGTKAFRVGDAEKFLAQFSGLPKHYACSLLSAPRVTFVPAAERQRLGLRPAVEVLPYSQEDFLKNLRDYSTSLLSFFEHEKPDAVIADFTTTYYREDKSSEPKAVHCGIAVALSARTRQDPETVDLALYCNQKTVRQRRRGLAFWSRGWRPEIFELPVELRMAYRLGETVGFVTKNPDRRKQTLVLVTITQLTPAGGESVEGSLIPGLPQRSLQRHDYALKP